ncbi:MAG: TIGR04086 family membrane protein [Syntrophaceticus sp.]
MNNDKSPSSRIGENPLFWGLAVAILFVTISIAIVSLFFYFSNISEIYLKPAGSFFYLAGAFLGGFFAAKKAGRRGLVYGIEVGVCYYVFFMIISFLLSPGSLSVTALALKGIYTILVSTAGGVCGLAFA